MTWSIPISVKGIIFNSDDKVLLLKNERNSWELPGGKIDKGEQPEQTLIREIYEELEIEVIIEKLIIVWIYEVIKDRHVLIVTYLCKFEDKQEIHMSEEHIDNGWFNVSDLESVDIAEGYKNSIRIAYSIYSKKDINAR